MTKLSVSPSLAPRHRPDVLADTAAAIRAHPEFRRAAMHYLENVLRWREGPRLLNKVVGSYVRSQVIGNLLFLHFSGDVTGDGEGPSFVRLLALSEARNHCGSRVLKTVLALTKLAGFVAVERGRNDARLRVYRPTEKLLEHVRAWYTQTLGCFDILAPGGHYAERVAREADFIARFLSSIGTPFFEHDIAIGEYYPKIYELLQLDCGFPVIATLVHATLRGDEMPSAPEISKKFGSSASQIRNVQKTAAALGLISISDNGRADDCARLAAMYQDFIARELALYAQYGLDLGGYFTRDNAHEILSR
ncbi:hypothetical protein JQ557_17095 [Bradyrhizobium sp. U87765 SZCCT0131]|uniref:hypothetical protein n=1 Tax=unclassified Bradyrhizobium TaxID=2631580 RepID=UPI001BAA5D09|nr:MULTISPECIES: hypothetical protein [unclassified Bradyrhizobium]MBR1219727.1 hypothetical protein [Bradyrhizobium sp. U87765 SZCCT0131]MBR1262378.1 hypothetical protein [Bradyrhizobium sp. U87765 SZCCT0134]MBR1308439.1 hypothetical protein [Bradyrhizobium sp. U87765 SZCCT0110]MBR1318160.1 hypothetical protein [Bradyrhizobium sp. U87765 SZCCT0109]MBR1351863.1 hypothetical protein [Bradyrhizobium sp. U87765 SZCCT0048]